MMKETYEGQVCVVTGAASGIGRELAICLGEHGARLAISDVNEIGLAETEAMLKDLGVEVHSQYLDVSDRTAVYNYPDQLLQRFRRVDQLYNNAGISGGGVSIAQTPDNVIDRVMDINLNGVLHMSRAFLPILTHSGRGKLVNISSLNGFLAQPNVAIYCTTKFAVRGLTEAMRADAMMRGEQIQIVVVHPGGVKTNIANARPDESESGSPETQKQAAKLRKIYQEKFLTYPARDAAMDILKGVARNKHRIIVTPDAKRLDILARVLPSSYIKLVVQTMQRVSRKAG